jgi:hypothetical protein
VESVAVRAQKFGIDPREGQADAEVTVDALVDGAGGVAWQDLLLYGTAHSRHIPQTGELAGASTTSSGRNYKWLGYRHGGVAVDEGEDGGALGGLALREREEGRNAAACARRVKIGAHQAWASR